jgi:hypothetical protein
MGALYFFDQYVYSTAHSGSGGCLPGAPGARGESPVLDPVPVLQRSNPEPIDG